MFNEKHKLTIGQMIGHVSNKTNQQAWDLIACYFTQKISVWPKIYVSFWAADSLNVYYIFLSVSHINNLDLE